MTAAGTWRVTGGAEGTVTYRWMEGGYFLIQDVELEGDTLTIWAGDEGSPAYFRGSFNEDGSVLDGAWVYPGGAGTTRP